MAWIVGRVRQKSKHHPVSLTIVEENHDLKQACALCTTFLSENMSVGKKTCAKATCKTLTVPMICAGLERVTKYLLMCRHLPKPQRCGEQLFASVIGGALPQNCLPKWASDMPGVSVSRIPQIMAMRRDKPLPSCMHVNRLLMTTKTRRCAKQR
jgi:hypothetical protein